MPQLQWRHRRRFPPGLLRLLQQLGALTRRAHVVHSERQLVLVLAPALRQPVPRVLHLGGRQHRRGATRLFLRDLRPSGTPASSSFKRSRDPHSCSRASNAAALPAMLNHWCLNLACCTIFRSKFLMLCTFSVQVPENSFS